MKKWLSLLLSLMMLLCCVCAYADALPVTETVSVSPFAPSALPEEIYTQWQLFTSDPAPEWKMTAVSDPETDCFVITLYNLQEWGVAEEYCTSWKYDLSNAQWLPMEETATDLSSDAAVLYMDAQEYYMNGFPGWECASEDELFYYRLEDYSGDPNNPDYYLHYGDDNAAFQYSLAGGGYSISSYGEEMAAMSYCVYDAAGTLTMGTYMTENDNGDLSSYAVIPNESSDPEAVEKEPYVLYYINVQTADGGNYLWTEGAWTNLEGIEVAAPEGYTADELPFVLIQP